MLNVIMLSVTNKTFMLSVIMLNVVAPLKHYISYRNAQVTIASEFLPNETAAFSVVFFPAYRGQH
jgi:hypothetical protein